MLSHHRILFLDEPTTGLSASDAALMIELIQRLAKERGTTIIFSVHQPRAQVFLDCIDKLLLLHEGKTTYFGPPKMVENYFKMAGSPFPKMEFSNPADLMIDKMADSMISSSLLSVWKKTDFSKNLDEEINNYLPDEEMNEKEEEKEKGGFIRLFKRINFALFSAIYNSFFETIILLQFGFRVFFRRKGVFVIAFFIEFGYSILKGLLFSELKDELDYFGDRQSSIFRSLDPGTGMVFLSLYVDLIPLSNRDLLVGRYGVISYCTMWIALTVVRGILLAFGNLIVYYWIAGLIPEFSNFLIFFGISILYKIAFFAILLAFAAITGSASAATTLLVIITIILYVNCGYYVPREEMWVGLSWFTYVSMFYYAYEGLSWTDISQRTFACDQEGCPVPGTELLESIGYQDRLSLDFSVLYLWMIAPILVFSGYVILFRVVLQLIRTQSFYRNQTPLIVPYNELGEENLNISSFLMNNNNNSDDDEDEESDDDDEDEIDDEEFIRYHNRKYLGNSLGKPKENSSNDQIEKESKESGMKFLRKPSLKVPIKDNKNNNNNNNNSNSSNELKKSRNILASSQTNSSFSSRLTQSIRKTILPKKREKITNSQAVRSMSSILSKTQLKRQEKYIDHSESIFNPSIEELEKCELNTLPIAHFRIENIRFEVNNSKFKCVPYLNEKNEKIILLQDISASFAPGTITAIMGNSGSGKSTLLHSVCGYLNTNFSRRIYGNIYGEGELVSGNCWPMNIVSFMGQHAEDYIFPNYTVEESFEFAAQLQLPLSIPYSEKKKLVNNILEVLRLKEVKDNVIGPIGARNVSGGQLRRIILGIEIMLRRSKIYLIDEPTSGLSASGAAEIVSILHSLASHLHCTVIVTIHQPRTEILNIFDNLIVLSKGYMIYNGPPNEIDSYFEKMGYPLPLDDCIADSMMDQIVADENTLRKSQNESDEDLENGQSFVTNIKDRKLIKNFVPPPKNYDEKELKEVPEIHKELRTPWYTLIWYQICLLSERRFILFCRSPIGRLNFFILTAMIAVIFSLFYLRIENTAKNVQYLMGASLVAGNFWLYMNTFNLFSFFIEKPMILHELAMHKYHPFSSYFTHFLFCLTEATIAAFIYTVIIFFMIGLGNTFTQFMLYYLAHAITAWIVLIYQYVVIWYCEKIDSVTNITGITIFCMGLDWCGYVCHLNHIPNYLQWLSWLSIQRYLMEMSYFAFVGRRAFPCEPDGEQSTVVPECPAPGNDFLIEFGYSVNPLLRDVLIVLGVNLLFFISGYFICKSRIISWTIHPPRTQKQIIRE